MSRPILSIAEKARTIGLVASVVLAMASLAFSSSAMAGDNPPDEVARASKELREARLKLLKASAELDALRKIDAAYDAPTAPSPRGGFIAGESVIREALRESESGKVERLQALEALLVDLEAKTQAAETAWKKAAELEEEIAPPWAAPAVESAAEEPTTIDASRVIAELVSPKSIPFGLGLLAILAALGVATLIERRGEWKIRRRGKWRRGRQLGVLLAFSLLVPSGIGCGSDDEVGLEPPKAAPEAGNNADASAKAEKDRILAAIGQRRKSLDEQLRSAESKLSAARASTQSKTEKAVRKEVAELIPSSPSNASEPVAELTKAELQAQEKVRSALVAVAVNRSIAADATKRAEVTRAHEIRTRKLAAADRRLTRIVAGSQFGAALLSLGVLALFLRASGKSKARQVATNNENCPRCLSPGLTRVPLELDSSIAMGRQLEVMQCGTCGHEFDARYQALERICLPIVGVRGSGKTHWAYVAYHQIKHSQIPVRSQLTPMPSQGTSQVDALSELVVERGYVPKGTNHGLPEPVLLRLKDRDPMGGRSALVNLMDYAGEVTGVNMDQMRIRAIRSDGFLYFLDPFQIDHDPLGEKVTLGDQVNALRYYYEDICRVRDLDLGTQVDMPIAVCVSMIDKLGQQDSWSAWTNKLRESMSQRVSLRLIQERSSFVEQYLDQMFPGADIARSVREKFGDRFLFFPVTPMGLEPGGARVPFGILEPMLWMLHMKGYDVFR